MELASCYPSGAQRSAWAAIISVKSVDPVLIGIPFARIQGLTVVLLKIQVFGVVGPL